MAINRRSFLQQTASLAITSPLVFSSNTFASRSASELIIGASRLSADQYALSAVNMEGRLQWQLPLPSRGHDVALHPSRSVGVAIARRPKTFLVLFDILTGKELEAFDVDSTLKLNGHACWVDDTLIVSASDRASSKMRLLSYSLKENRLKQAKRYSFDYIGPHEIIATKQAIWVAVGGLITQGRQVLNPNNLESYLLELSPTTLSVVNEYAAPFKSVSLRHLALSDKGTVYIAGQYQRAPENSPPLLFALQNNTLKPFNAPKKLWSQVKGYIGSIVFSDGQLIASSPRAHWLGWFSEDELALTKNFLSPDVCALADSQDGLVAGSGTGRLFHKETFTATKVRWDNHFAHHLIHP